MKLPRYKAGPADYWVGAALTEFINGFIAGLGGGSVVGAGTGAVTANTELGDGVSTQHQVIIALTTVILSASGNGLKRIIVWHDRNPFPNPWLAPATPATDQPPTP